LTSKKKIRVFLVLRILLKALAMNYFGFGNGKEVDAHALMESRKKFYTTRMLWGSILVISAISR
jgi:hypothetical protein